MRLSRQAWFLLVAFLLPLPFLFLKQLAPGETAWLQRMWDVGHVPLFATWMVVALWLVPLPVNVIFVIVRALVLFGVAVSIEFIQLRTGRQFSLLDMYLDACGIALGVRLGIYQIRALPRPQRHAIDVVLALCICLGLQDAGKALFGRVYIGFKFPQLWSASQLFPLNRVEGNSKRSIVTDQHTGQPLMKVVYSTAMYSGMQLTLMTGDWRGYDSLNIAIMNPSTEPLDISCRVHDVSHFPNGAKSTDRFNRRLSLAHGWNTLSFSLKDIESAPATRKMQMDQIENLNCFTSRLTEPTPVYYREIWLAK